MEKRYCNICNNLVAEEDQEELKKEYPYYCENCDENLYEFETYSFNSILNEL